MLHVALHPVFYLALAAAHRPPRKLLLLLLAVAVHATEPPSPSPSPPPRPAALPAWTCPGGACCKLGAVLGQTIAPAFGGNDWTAQEKEAFCEGALDKLATTVDTTFDGSQLVTIGGGAFARSGVTSLALPASLKTLGSGAFRLKAIGAYAFDDFKTIGAYAF
eukprot:gene5506-4767_t